VDWSKLPDIVAIGLLASAFASVARRNATRVSGIWLTGWLLILLHFIALLFLPVAGLRGLVAGLFGLASLTWAGVLFIWSSVPFRKEGSTRWMLAVLVLTNTLYVCVLGTSGPAWMLNFAAALLGLGPLAIAVSTMHRFNHPLRWVTVILYLGLAVFLLIIQHRPANGPDLALNAVLFTVYFDCGIHFWYTYRRATTGRFITVYGFFAWSSVFLFSPFKDAWFPNIHIENEVWNLPKYVVATGMILLLLEEQIEHNKHLALHDPLTGLPNRRLFQDRLANALERARRSGSQAALLVLDLDHFKNVNDTLGHHVGDLLLQRVAKIFGGRVRRSDTVARTGGDEFSVILEGPTNGTEALHVGHLLQEMLKEPMQLENRTVRIGASLGVAIFPDDAPDMESLCIAADLRMYDNKRENADLEKDHPRGEISSVPGRKNRDSTRRRFPR
jgi:diguanylate cyclase (GGDEF)-like protein